MIKGHDKPLCPGGFTQRVNQFKLPNAAAKNFLPCRINRQGPVIIFGTLW